MVHNFEISDSILKKFTKKIDILKAFASGERGQQIFEFSDENLNQAFLIARNFLEQKRYHDALSVFIFLISLNLNKSEYWLGFGTTWQYIHNFEMAINCYEMAAIYDLENPWPYFYLAKCFFAIHDRKNAEQALDLAIQYSEFKEEFTDLKLQALKAKETLMET